MVRFLRKKRKTEIIIDPDEILADSISVLRYGGQGDLKLERPLARLSSFLFLFLAGSVFFVLLFYAALLQIRRGGEFFLRSEENRFFVRTTFAPRGIIFDLRGKPFVKNVPSFGVRIKRDEFFKQNGSDGAARTETLRVILGKDKTFLRELDFLNGNISASLPATFVVLRNIPLEDAVDLASHTEELSGIEVFEEFQREYLDSYAYSHLIGFVGKVSEEDMAQRPHLLFDSMTGKNGIESMYDDMLTGKRGKKIIEVDSLGQESRFKFVEEPKEGKSVFITVDSELQSAAYEIFDRYVQKKRGGSVVMLDPRTGAVRAMVSYPGFDSNAFGVELSSEEFDRVLKNPLKPFFNRAVSGEFPAGSTIKPLIAISALEEGIIDPKKRIYDEGFIEIQNPYDSEKVSVFKDWKKHGWVDFYDAIAVSANVYFYMIGGGFENQKGLGIRAIKRYAEKFGLGSRLGIDFPGERPGVFPDPEIKAALEPRDPQWRVGDTYNVSIGQGGVRVTPLQIASLSAAIANGGTLFTPYILDEIRDADGGVTRKSTPKKMRENLAREDSLYHVRLGMRRAVTFGTAGKLSNLPVAVAAKTGTAQAGSGKPHAWVTGFAPYENPEIAFAVMVEHAGEGTTETMPIARDILEWYFTHFR